MADDHADKIWDEYDWERFLQQQERRTDLYMELLEKFMDDPRRDEIIAREMGWSHLVEEDAREWEDEVDAQFEKELSGDGGAGEVQGQSAFAFQRHPLYQQTLAFTVELDEVFDGTSEGTQNHPATIQLHSQVTLAAAKLAAALNDDDADELGMTIAYLKRALHAINTSLEALAQLGNAVLLEEDRIERMRRKVFAIRDGIVSKMGACRAEFWKRRGR
jgi:hypothetical protein